MTGNDLTRLNSKELSADAIKEKLADMLDEERFTHSIAVSELAAELASIHGFDPAKAELAGLVHDCAKCMPPAELIKKIYEYRLELDEIEKRTSSLWHAIVSAHVARTEFGIEDDEIIRAIRLHTTGDSEMGWLDKIIFIADYADPTRDYEDSGRIRQIARCDLIDAWLETAKQKIIYVIQKKNVLIHPKTIATHNSAVSALNGRL